MMVPRLHTNYSKSSPKQLGFTHNNIPVVPTFSCTYDLLENILTIQVSEDPDAAFGGFKLEFYNDEKLRTKFKYSTPNSINTIIRNTTETLIVAGSPHKCYLDLFQTRNLYLTSSALCSYDTVSNFVMDTIIKKIPCTASYNKLFCRRTPHDNFSTHLVSVAELCRRFLENGVVWCVVV